jgi:hypothetical protein
LHDMLKSFWRQKIDLAFFNLSFMRKGGGEKCLKSF